VSKTQLIRKKALDLVRDQDWPNAIKEYRRLVELDQSNPNVHNELADLYLKTNQKAEAYDAFVRAVDEYNRVGLFNNAVAVCKKVLRVLPARHEVLVKLGYIRSRQGLSREAESYYSQFLEKTADGTFDRDEFKKLVKPIVDDVADSAGMLDRIAQAFIAMALPDDAGDVMVRVFTLCEKAHDSAGAEKARAALEKLGQLDKLAATGKDPDARTVITEDTLWTKSHSEGERIQVETTPRTTPTGSPAAPAPQPAGAAPGGPSERDLYLLRLARGSAEARPRPASAAAHAEQTPPAVPAAEPVDAGAVAVAEPEIPAVAPEVSAAPEPETDPEADVRAAEPPAPAAPEPPAPKRPSPAPPMPDRSAAPKRPSPPAPSAPSAPGNNGVGLHVSALIDDDGVGAGNETDYRSHYDLGMAYIEMALYTEAIREYQHAARSPQYQVKCLEMIGLCFIKQNQPQLAIRQLTKGLSLIGNESEESLGIKYNLGLAHEMIGDLANARTYFEDVYVVDVTFRDVSDKVRRLTDSS
jgi:tetratricopeptide (TPR) repeat protein